MIPSNFNGKHNQWSAVEAGEAESKEFVEQWTQYVNVNLLKHQLALSIYDIKLNFRKLFQKKNFWFSV